MQVKNKREFINNVTIKLTKYEEERKKRIRKLIITELKAIAIICAGCFGVDFFIAREASILLVLSAGAVFFAIVFFFTNIFDYNKDFKKFLKGKCRKNILDTFNLATMHGIKFSTEELKKSNLFSTFNREEHDDVIQGKHNDVDYVISETKLIAKGRKSEATVFKGIIISFKSNKRITTETLITTKGDYNIRNYPPNGKFLIYWFVGWLTILSIIFAPYTFLGMRSIINSGHDIIPQIIKLTCDEMIGFAPILLSLFIVLCIFYVQKKKMQDVKLESISFNKKFNIYTKDQVEARYLLTPSFMERLQNLETAFGTKGIKCSFFDDKIMFAIPVKKDLFELGSLFSPLSSNKPVEKFYEELNSIQEMIEYFKLDKKLDYNNGLN